jgi:O-antigen/teichoic acid export membrane protein
MLEYFRILGLNNQIKSIGKRQAFVQAKAISMSRDPLYNSSLFIMLGRISASAFGFLFWMIAAKLYSMDEIGIAAVIYSSLSLVQLLSRLGLDYAQTRFVTFYEKEKIFNSFLSVTTVASFIIASIYVYLIISFSDEVEFSEGWGFIPIFIFSGALFSIQSTIGNTFISWRRSKQYFIQNILLGMRVIFLAFLSSFGYMGIILSISIAYIFSISQGMFAISKDLTPRIEFNKVFIRNSLRFSMANYFSSILSSAPVFILPIIILSLLGEESAAKYYITFAVANLIFMIPSAISTSLFVEGSRDDNIDSFKAKSFNALITIYIILIIIFIFIYLFGGNLLSLFGKEYSDTSYLLRIFALSSFLVAIYYIYIPFQNIHFCQGAILKINVIYFVALLSLTYILVLKLGIVGAGYAWLITYLLIDLLILGLMLPRKDILNSLRRAINNG